MTGTDAQLLCWILAWGTGLAFFVSYVAAAAMGRPGHTRPPVPIAVVLIVAAVYGVLSKTAIHRAESVHDVFVAAACAALVPVAVGHSLGRLRSRRAAAGSVSTPLTRTVAAVLDVAHYAIAIALATVVLAVGSGVGVLLTAPW